MISDHAARAAALRDKYAAEEHGAPGSDDGTEAVTEAGGAAVDGTDEAGELQPATTLEGAAARAAEREKRMAAYREKELAAKAARERKRALDADREMATRAKAELERAREEVRKEREAREQLEAKLREPSALFALA
jgi:hypothetical protein